MPRFSFLALALGAAFLPGLLAAATVKGTIEPHKKVTVNSPVIQEVITDIKVKEGSTVKEGEVIVELRKEREELDVQLSEKLIALKQFVARGQMRLFKEDKAVSEEKALEAETDLELARLQLNAKKVALREKTVISPIEGVVVKVYKAKGESADRTEKLMDIINFDKVLAKFFVPPEVRQTLKLDQTVKVRVGGANNLEVEGKIEFIDPRNDPASTFVLVHVLIDNPGHRINPGMPSEAEFGK